MQNRHFIYSWMFFPLLAILLASGATSCINDPTMEEEDMAGKTTLSVTVRGVSQEPSSDEYIKTLRIIVFDASGMVCNQFYSENDIENWVIKASGTDTYYEITQKLANFSGGSSRFYFIANEEGYTVYGDDNTSLTDLLSKGGLTEDGLKECIIASDDQDWSAKPILMI